MWWPMIKHNEALHSSLPRGLSTNHSLTMNHSQHLLTINRQLVGGFNMFQPSWKYEFVNGKDDIPYMKWKVQFMFETTQQLKYFVNYPSNYGFPMLSPSFHVRNKQIPSSHPSPRFFTVLQDDLQDFTQGEELHTAFLGQRSWANRRIAAVLMGKNMGQSNAPKKWRIMVGI